jgi:hypothetical protein
LSDSIETVKTTSPMPGTRRLVIHVSAELEGRVRAFQARERAERPQVPLSFASAFRTLAHERLLELESESGSAA